MNSSRPVCLCGFKLDRGESVDRMDTIGGERRGDRRYEMQLELRWKLIKRRRVVDAGVGYTLDLSSGGIRFHAGRELPIGLNVELTLQWPILLNNVAPMSLSIYGKIVRTGDGWAAIRTVQHEFRTAGMQLGDRGARAAATAISRTRPGS